MKKWKLAAGLGALWLAFLSLLSLGYVLISHPKAEYTMESESLRAEDRLYVADNASGFGVVYEITPNGKVEKLYSTSGKPYFNGWQIAALSLPSEDDAEDALFYALARKQPEENAPEKCRILRFSKDAVADAATPEYMIDDGLRITGLAQNGGAFYITTIPEDRKDILVYTIEDAQLYPLDTKEEEFTADAQLLSASVRKEAQSGVYWADAIYDGESFSTRTDAQAPANIFAEDEDVRVLFDDRSETLVQYYQVSGLSPFVFFAAVLGGLLAVIAGGRGFSSQKRIFYRILRFELMLFVALLAIFSVICVKLRAEHERGYLEAGRIALSMVGRDVVNVSDASGLYDSAEYSALLGQMRTVAEYAREDGGGRIADVCLYRVSTGEIVADLLGHARENIRFVYGEDASRSHYVFLTAAVNGSSEYAVMAAIEFPRSLFSYLLLGQLWLPAVAVLIFAALSVLGIRSILREGEDIRDLGQALKSLAEGDYSFRKPELIYGWDMAAMWNSVNEIRRHIKSINYLQFMVYKAYYRFAPKNVERILKKDSITDVKSGDAIRLFGTQVLIRTERQKNDDPHEIQRRNEFLEVVQRQLRAEDGIFISSDTDLSLTRILFLEDSPGCVRFGVNLLQEIRSGGLDKVIPPTSVLMHRAPFVYGVAGTDEQASAFLASPEKEYMEMYLGWFHKLHLDVVVTESVVEAEEGLGDLRHIGFVEGDGGRVNIYEVLDAEETRIHMAKFRLIKSFEEALSLYYAQDFYLARNAFTDILREVPEDEMAKWYLFECEKLLNDPPGETFTGALEDI